MIVSMNIFAELLRGEMNQNYTRPFLSGDATRCYVIWFWLFYKWYSWGTSRLEDSVLICDQERGGGGEGRGGG